MAAYVFVPAPIKLTGRKESEVPLQFELSRLRNYANACEDVDFHTEAPILLVYQCSLGLMRYTVGQNCVIIIIVVMIMIIILGN